MKKYKIVYMDTETTGLSPIYDEIVSISMVSDTGEVLLDTLVKPVHNEEWPEAEKIHGITPAMVAEAPTMAELAEQIETNLRAAELIVGYNIPFDWGFVSPHIKDGDKWDWHGCELTDGIVYWLEDPMIEFAEIYGEWSEWHQNFRWQKLSTAMSYYKLPWRGTAHGSLADTYAVKAMYEAMHPDEAPKSE